MVRSQRCLFALAISAGLSGCVSSSTWRQWDETADAIERSRAPEVESERSDHAARTFAFGTCSDVVRAVVSAHPRLEEPRHRARSALARARAEGALPAPSARVELWDFPIGDPSLADREGMYMLGVAQELPPAAVLDGRARALVVDARAALGELAEGRRDIGTAASHACVDWARASQRVERARAWIAVLDRMHDGAIARLGAGGGSLADVPRVERERATAERALRRAEGDLARAEETVRAHLGADHELALGSPPQLPDEAPPMELDALLRSAASARGTLVAARARIASAEARIAASEAAAHVPTFMIGATYMQTPQSRAGLGLELTMTLPWLWSGGEHALDAAREDALADLAGAASLERDIAVELRAALAEVRTTAATLTVLRDRETPAAERALEAVTAGYGAGGGDLLDWLDAARAIRELELEEAELRGELGHALAEVESIVGASLTESAVAP